VDPRPVWYFGVGVGTSSTLNTAWTHVRVLHHGRAAASPHVTGSGKVARAKSLVASA
jgi:hypothetical protein